jgi:hypothetical protein
MQAMEPAAKEDGSGQPIDLSKLTKEEWESFKQAHTIMKQLREVCNHPIHEQGRDQHRPAHGDAIRRGQPIGDPNPTTTPIVASANAQFKAGI